MDTTVIHLNVIAVSLDLHNEEAATPQSVANCPDCRGSGSIGQRSVCSCCLGRGVQFTTAVETKRVACSDCGGSGRRFGAESESCWKCGGGGTQDEAREHQVETGPCLHCHGEPFSERLTKCSLCHGTGKISSSLRWRLRWKWLFWTFVKVIAIIVLSYLLLGAFVYFTKQL
jgi:DnaJ-class molecular chaperone